MIWFKYRPKLFFWLFFTPFAIAYVFYMRPVLQQNMFIFLTMKYQSQWPQFSNATQVNCKKCIKIIEGDSVTLWPGSLLVLENQTVKKGNKEGVSIKWNRNVDVSSEKSEDFILM